MSQIISPLSFSMRVAERQTLLLSAQMWHTWKIFFWSTLGKGFWGMFAGHAGFAFKRKTPGSCELRKGEPFLNFKQHKSATGQEWGWSRGMKDGNRKARAKHLRYNYSLQFFNYWSQPLTTTPLTLGSPAQRHVQETCPNPDQSHISPWSQIHRLGWPVAGCPRESRRRVKEPRRAPWPKRSICAGAMSICLSVEQHILSWLSNTALCTLLPNLYLAPDVTKVNNIPLGQLLPTPE